MRESPRLLAGQKDWVEPKMHFADPSPLSLAAAFFYGFVAFACLLADRASNRRPYRPAFGWGAIAAVFALLAAMRFLAGEDILRAELREWIDYVGLQSERRAWQWPLTIAVLVMAGISGFATIRRMRSHGRDRSRRSLEWAWLATFAMLALLTVRIVSLHQADSMLFSRMFGPIRFNWVLDIGLSTVVLLAAISATRLASRADRS